MSAHISVNGRLVADPKFHTFDSGKQVAHLRIAANFRTKNRNGEWEEKSIFFNSSLYGDHGANIAKLLVKGSRVFVAGELQEREYEAQGETRKALDIIFPKIDLIDTKSEGEARRGGGYSDEAPSGDGNKKQQGLDYDDAEDIPF